MRQFLLSLSLALFLAVPVSAQTAVQIDPGMSRAEVIERLGRPATERTSGGFTYMFFINGCERTCGMNDLVTLQGDAVIDAIFRAPHREYTGRSSSPTQDRTPRANRGPLAITPAQPGDSAVFRIIPVDSARPARDLPLGDLTGKTIVPGARPDSLRSTRLPSDARQPATQRDTTVNPPSLRPDTSRNTPGTRPDTTRGSGIPINRSDTVINPRRPVPPPPPAATPGTAPSAAAASPAGLPAPA